MPGAPIRSTTAARGTLAIVLSALALNLLVGCGTPAPAPVSSREHPRASIPETTRHYRVERGDTLYSIAWRAGLDYRQLASWNDIRRPYTIYPGQRLILKPPARKTSSSRIAASTKTKKPGSKASTAKKTKATTAKSSNTKTRPSRANRSTGKSGTSGRSLKWRWPTDGKVIQTFSHKDRSRQGIEIAGRFGQPVHATESGKIVYSGSGLIGYGQLIIIKHNNNYLSAYGHNRKILVKEGDEVIRGQRIAEMGRPPDGQPVLHFEIRRKGTPVNPIPLLPGKG